MPENTPIKTLKKHFGYDHFLPNQEEVINYVLSGEDTLAVMPTGSGKSIIYQLPALMLEGMTLVVSPLIALMKDQVESLKAHGIKAAYINSMLMEAESRTIYDSIKSGDLKILYIAPEKLLSEKFLEFISSVNLSLIAIDEAHCISNWGHDFRPEYNKLHILKEKFPNIPVIALTATADKITREDILVQLKLTKARIVLASFNRPNLSLNVLPGINRFDMMLRFISQQPNSSGIIYCLSRKSTEDLSKKLNAEGIKATFYHAGMERKAREKAQEDFIRDDIPVICATIAFGMGIDKSNVRWIIHYNMPKSMENFYQEIGRAGRDSLASDTLLFYTFRDVMMLRQFAEDSGQPEIQHEKLQRMQQYAEASSCRRRVLLSYFNEHIEEDCGNCDVCKDPPQSFDGSIIAQKALSAIYRMNENVASSMLIDVLRGSGKRQVFDMGYNQVKTYGQGRDISYFDWQQYLLQMLNQGLFDIAYDDHQKLKITNIGRKVLFENKKLRLVKPQSLKQLKKEKQKAPKKLTKKERLKIELLRILTEMRKGIADRENVAPHIIFNDNTLDSLAELRPDSDLGFMEIPGVGSFKFEKYGKPFIERIIDFKIQNKDRGNTQLITKKLLDEGKKINEIARERDLSVLTVIGHLSQIYEKSIDFNIFQHIPSFNHQEIVDFIASKKGDTSHKEVYNKFRGKYEYHQIRIAFAAYNKRLN